MAHLLWTLLAGHLLPSRGALFPALQHAGMSDRETRQAEAALREGKWSIQSLLDRFCWLMNRERQEQQTHRVSIDGWKPLLIDWVGFFRPRLAQCASKHFDSLAGKALPAIELGMVATIQQVQDRVIPALVDLNRSGDTLALVQLAQARQRDQEVVIADRQVKVSHLQQAGVKHFVIRAPQNLAARKSQIPPQETGKRGRKPTRGEIVRPLARSYRGNALAATEADREEVFVEEGRQLTAKWFDRIKVSGCCLIVSCLVIQDPRYKNAWVLLTDLENVSAQTVYRLYRSRWKIEQLPQTGKQLLGGHRSFVHAATSRYRLPELCLLCASLSLYLSATCKSMPTGFWDRHPARTPGRYRRALSAAALPEFRQLSVGCGRVREKASVHAHLQKGRAAHCRRTIPKNTPAVTGN